ncbi:odorant receptor Or2-like [Schistocerca gregaria]|uniref:odorant receptor Or2-like n=1 Tax=Schistocerca gregaria TaxID=7010 RepID=UPI00211E540A|nr:odorant receptor Or2-like [Schistocerca gregaria]
MLSTWRSLAQLNRLQKPWSKEEGQYGSGRTLAGQVLYLTVAGMWPRGRGTPYLLYVPLVQLCAVSYVAVGVQEAVVIGLDGFFVAAMLHVGALLQLLGQRVSGVRLAGDGEADLSGDAGLKVRQMLYAELSACISSHQKITKFLRHLESAMGAMVLVQLSSTMLNLCIGLYHQTKIRDVLTALQYAMLLPFYSSQIYFYCWTADAITQQGVGLSLAAYSSWWVGAGTSFQKALSILMARAHKPLVITAGRLYPINTAAFVAVSPNYLDLYFVGSV